MYSVLNICELKIFQSQWLELAHLISLLSSFQFKTRTRPVLNVRVFSFCKIVSSFPEYSDSRPPTRVPVFPWYSRCLAPYRRKKKRSEAHNKLGPVCLTRSPIYSRTVIKFHCVLPFSCVAARAYSEKEHIKITL